MQTQTAGQGKTREPKAFDLVAMIFVATLLISNIAAQKLFAFGSLVFTAGIIVFPITYIFGDILTEVYGYSRTRKVIWTGFICNAFMALVLWVAIKLPPAPGWPLQEEFAKVLGRVPRIVLASILGYWVGEFTNSYIMAKMKLLTKGRWLPARTISSTFVGQLTDSCTFVFCAFLFVFNISLILKTILFGWLFKVTYEIIITPITVLVINWLKRYEGIDHYDTETNFNPFAVFRLKAAKSRTVNLTKEVM